MNTRKQIILAAAIVGVAGASVGLYAAIGSPTSTPRSRGGSSASMWTSRVRRCAPASR